MLRVMVGAGQGGEGLEGSIVVALLRVGIAAERDSLVGQVDDQATGDHPIPSLGVGHT